MTQPDSSHNATRGAADTFEVTSSLAKHLRGLSKPPIVFEEVALEGSWGSHGRLDVVTLTIAPHYRGAILRGYEVKVSRGDLFNDLDKLKYRRYLEAVTSLTVAMPAGLAKLDEIPAELGVMTYQAGKWTTARRATVTNGKGELTLDTAMRLIRRLDTHRAVADRRESKLDRLKRMAEAESEYALRIHLSAKAQEIIRKAEAKAADYNRKLQELEKREAAMEGADQVLEQVSRLLGRAQHAASLGSRALGRHGYGGTDHMADARRELESLVGQLMEKAS